MVVCIKCHCLTLKLFLFKDKGVECFLCFCSCPWSWVCVCVHNLDYDGQTVQMSSQGDPKIHLLWKRRSSRWHPIRVAGRGSRKSLRETLNAQCGTGAKPASRMGEPHLGCLLLVDASATERGRSQKFTSLWTKRTQNAGQEHLSLSPFVSMPALQESFKLHRALPCDWKDPSPGHVHQLWA